MAKGPSGQKRGQLLPKGEEDNQDVTIRCLQAQLLQVLVANNLIKLVTKAGERPFKVRSTRCKDIPQGGQKGKKVESHYTKAESQISSKIVASGIRRVPSS